MLALQKLLAWQVFLVLELTVTLSSILSYAQVKASLQPTTPFKSQLSLKNLIRREIAICAKRVFKTLQLKMFGKPLRPKLFQLLGTE